MKYGGKPCEECGLPMEACNKIALAERAIRHLRAALTTIAETADQFDDVDPDDGLHSNSVREYARKALNDPAATHC